MITKTSGGVLSGRDRWMIHAVLHGGVGISESSNLKAVMGDRATLINVDEFVVVASQIEMEQRSEVSLQCQIKEFSSLVNDLHRCIDILPFRFGVIVTAGELVNALRDNQEWYRTCLHAIAGFTELNLRWAVAEGPGDTPSNPSSVRGPSAAKGFEYLKSKLISKQVGSQIENELGVIANDFRNRFQDEEIKWQSSVGKLKVKSPGPNEDCYVIARIELLVRRGAALAILSEGSNVFLRSEKPTVASGPWPPYSFIESGNVGSLSQQMQRCAITFPNEAVS
ncbi:MAG: GvpL/GvpF family gas vesicle protein [Pirellula sp.]